MTTGAAGPTAATIARVILITIALVAASWLLWSGLTLLFVLFFGILVALFLSVFVDRLVGLGMPRIPALLLVLLALALLVGGFMGGLWPTVRDQMAMVVRDMPDALEQVREWGEEQYRSVTGRFGEPSEGVEERLRNDLSRQMGTLLGGAMPILNSVAGGIAGMLIVLATGIYLAADPGLYRRGAERLILPRHRERVHAALSRTGGTLKRWMVGTLVNMLLVGLMVTVGLWLIGVPAAIALGVIAGVLEFIPIFGPIIAAVPAIALGLTVSPLTALWVALLFTAIQQLESNVLTPLVMRGAVRLPPALTLLFQSFMAVVFGFLGLLLAVPILAAGVVMMEELYVVPMEERGG